jgi:hypothetical protein
MDGFKGGSGLRDALAHNGSVHVNGLPTNLVKRPRQSLLGGEAGVYWREVTMLLVPNHCLRTAMIKEDGGSQGWPFEVGRKTRIHPILRKPSEEVSENLKKFVSGRSS